MPEGGCQLQQCFCGAPPTGGTQGHDKCANVCCAEVILTADKGNYVKIR